MYIWYCYYRYVAIRRNRGFGSGTIVCFLSSEVSRRSSNHSFYLTYQTIAIGIYLLLLLFYLFLKILEQKKKKEEKKCLWINVSYLSCITIGHGSLRLRRFIGRRRINCSQTRNSTFTRTIRAAKSTNQSRRCSCETTTGSACSRNRCTR